MVGCKLKKMAVPNELKKTQKTTCIYIFFHIMGWMGRSDSNMDKSIFLFFILLNPSIQIHNLFGGHYGIILITDFYLNILKQKNYFQGEIDMETNHFIPMKTIFINF